MKGKPCKLVMEKNLSGLGAEREVSFGDAPPARRAEGDYSKEGIKHVSPDSFDDYREKMEHWDKEYGKL
ncbi:MAG: hypothetical protein ABW110_03760 [Steroidobacteraceae bacterium]